MGKTLNYTQLMMQGKIYYYIHLVEIKLLHPFRKEFLQHPLSETMFTPLTRTLLFEIHFSEINTLVGKVTCSKIFVYCGRKNPEIQ